MADSLRLSKTGGVHGESFFLRAESYFNVATEIEQLDREPGGGPSIIGAYGGVSLHEQSHGESFFALFKNRFRHHGLYFLDEPEAALSPKRQLEFLALLHDFVKDGAQFVIATHSPIILAYPCSTINQFDESGIREVAYTDTDHYKITRGFLSNHRELMREIMEQPLQGL